MRIDDAGHRSYHGLNYLGTVIALDEYRSKAADEMASARTLAAGEVHIPAPRDDQLCDDELLVASTDSTALISRFA